MRWALLAVIVGLGGAVVDAVVGTLYAQGPMGDVAKAVQALPMDPWLKFFLAVALVISAVVGRLLVKIGTKIHEQLKSPVSNRSMRGALDDLLEGQLKVQASLAKGDKRAQALHRFYLRLHVHVQGLEQGTSERFTALTSVVEELGRHFAHLASAIESGAAAKRDVAVAVAILEELGERLTTLEQFTHKVHPEFTPRHRRSPSSPSLSVPPEGS
jgi:hypothetical protein